VNEVDEVHALIDWLELGTLRDEFHVLADSLSQEQVRELLIRMRAIRRRLVDKDGFAT
jgi:hypothetical protein